LKQASNDPGRTTDSGSGASFESTISGSGWNQQPRTSASLLWKTLQSLAIVLFGWSLLCPVRGARFPVNVNLAKGWQFLRGGLLGELCSFRALRNGTASATGKGRRSGAQRGAL